MTEQDAADAAEDEEADTDYAGNGADGDVADVQTGDTTVVEGDGTDDAAETGESVEGGDGVAEVDEALVERVAESEPESVAHELAALRTRVEGLEDQLDAREEEIDDLTGKLKRKQADFQNFKKRMEKRREQERERATEDLVERLLDVRDNLVRALDQADADAEVDADGIRDGVETTLSQFDRVLEDENVDIVAPEPGEEVDPHTHEVLMRVDSAQPEGTIDEVHRPGYVMAEKVLQTAQVTVSDGD
jgi:molecular chaperone GrpE